MKKLLISLWLLYSQMLFSQSEDSTSKKTENYFKFTYDNDFFSATDRYYTQGILIDFIHPVIKYSPFSYSLIKLKNSKNYFGLHLEQDVFTPISIRYKSGQIYYGERPFSAIFFISHTLHSLNKEKKVLLNTQLDIGFIGPYAKGEEEQKGIHKALKNIEPQGWQNQLSTDFILNYKLKMEKGIITIPNFDMLLNVSARLGTLYTDATIGINCRTGILNSYFDNLGLEKMGTKNKFKLFLVGKVNTTFVGYNTTLQGGLFSKSIYTLSANEINRVVMDAYYGIVLSYKGLCFEYAKTFITPEFNAGVNHGWGRCIIAIGF